ncbi:MAG: ECF transporter S component, partial [Microbacterium sp.]
MNRVTTAFLLTCAAIGVAGGVLLWGAAWASTVLFATVPFASAALAGLWLLPATVALRLLERPLAGILVGVLSGLVVFPFIGAAIWWAFFAELAFIVALYRSWRTWQYYAGAVFVGLIYPVLAAASFDLWSMPTWALIGFFAL